MFAVLLFCYWQLVSASKGHHQANIYKTKQKKKLKMLVHVVQKRQFYGIPFTFIISLCNYYQLLFVLSVVRFVENSLIKSYHIISLLKVL